MQRYIMRLALATRNSFTSMYIAPATLRNTSCASHMLFTSHTHIGRTVTHSVVAIEASDAPLPKAAAAARGRAPVSRND